MKFILQRLTVAIALLLFFSACQKTAENESRPVSGHRAESKAPTTAPVPPVADLSSVLGQFEAYSKSAESITGGLKVDPKTLDFEFQQIYQTNFVDVVNANAPYAAGPNNTWQKLLGIAESDPVEIRSVSSQEMGPSVLVRGNLCNSYGHGDKAPKIFKKATFLALARTPARGSRDTALLALAAFSGAARPGPDVSQAAVGLCGTFHYAPATPEVIQQSAW